MSKSTGSNLEKESNKITGKKHSEEDEGIQPQFQAAKSCINQIKEVDESFSDMNVVDYEDLATFTRYNVGEDGTDHQIQSYQSYAKALERRVRAKLEHKAALANLKAQQEQKAKLQAELASILRNKAHQKQLIEQNLKNKRDHLIQQLRLQQQLKKSLKSELQSLEWLINLSKSTVSAFPRQKMHKYLKLMCQESQGIRISGIKITHQLELEQVLLQNLEQIVSELNSF